MEEKSLTPTKTTPSNIRKVIAYLLCSLPLALPIGGVMHFDGKTLANIELGDPVNLYTAAPLPMQMVSIALTLAFISAFTPFKRLSSMATGLAIGGIAFYALDQYEQLKDLEEMGLSSKPLMEMFSLTSDGKALLIMTGLCLATQTIYALISPVTRYFKAKKSR